MSSLFGHIFCLFSLTPILRETIPEVFGGFLMGALQRSINFIRDNVETILIGMILLTYSALIIFSIVFIRVFV